jgi:hypothetical protein
LRRCELWSSSQAPFWRMLVFVTVAGALVGVTRIDTFAVARRFA